MYNIQALSNAIISKNVARNRNYLAFKEHLLTRLNGGEWDFDILPHPEGWDSYPSRRVSNCGINTDSPDKSGSYVRYSNGQCPAHSTRMITSVRQKAPYPLLRGEGSYQRSI